VRSRPRLRYAVVTRLTRSSAADGAGEFPPTRLSVLVDVRAGDPSLRARSLGILALGYWGPVYKHLRLRWRKPRDEAEEVTQAFFAAAVEKGFFAGYDPAKARFRTFVRTCVDRFAADERKASRRLKRGGGHRPVSWDAEVAEQEIEAATQQDDVEAVFEREFRRNLFRIALASLRAELSSQGRERHLRVFESYDLAPPAGPPSYERVAGELGIKVSDVTYSLHFARRALRRHVLERLRELTITDEEYELEARALGVAEGAG
jgi:RNA polymerase sigma factor (sigma-70 family)